MTLPPPRPLPRPLLREPDAVLLGGTLPPAALPPPQRMDGPQLGRAAAAGQGLQSLLPALAARARELELAPSDLTKAGTAGQA